MCMCVECVCACVVCVLCVCVCCVCVRACVCVLCVRCEWDGGGSLIGVNSIVHGTQYQAQ